MEKRKKAVVRGTEWAGWNRVLSHLSIAESELEQLIRFLKESPEESAEVLLLFFQARNQLRQLMHLKPSSAHERDE